MMHAIKPELVKKDLYESSQIILHDIGIISYPLPGTVINYSEEEGNIIFAELGKSRRYFEEVTNAIVRLIEELLLKINKNLARH